MSKTIATKLEAPAKTAVVPVKTEEVAQILLEAQAKYETAARQLAGLKASKQSLTESLAKYKHDISAAQQNYQSIHRDKSALITQHNTVVANFKSCHERYQLLAGEVAKQKQELLQLEKSAAEASTRIVQAKATIKGNKKNLTKLDAAISKCDSKIAACHQKQLEFTAFDQIILAKQASGWPIKFPDRTVITGSERKELTACYDQVLVSRKHRTSFLGFNA